MLISVFYHAGIAQRLVHLPSKQRMTVRFCLPAQNNKLRSREVVYLAAGIRLKSQVRILPPLQK